MRIRAIAPVLVGVGMVASLGVVHGLYTDRWGASSELQEAVGSLDRVPTVFGDWVGEDVPFEAEDMSRAGIKGTIFRRYHNLRTRESVSVLIVCGRGGPISVHTPDVCYTGAGFRQVTSETPSSVDLGAAGAHTFRTTRFAKPSDTAKSQLEIFWTWSKDGRSWQAPENARIHLARSPALYKMYVVREFVPGTRAESIDTCRNFLNRALPEICEALALAE